MNPVRSIPMVPAPKKVLFIPRASLHSIQAIRSLAWRRGASGDDGGMNTGPEDANWVNLDDPNQTGTGVKSAWDPGGTSTGTSAGGGTLPNPNTGVYSATQVAVSPASGANLRDQPSTSGNILAGENQGTILQVVGQPQNGWLNVQDPQGRVGWIYSAYVTDASSGQGTVAAPSGGGNVLAPNAAPGAAQVSSMPLGAPGIVGLLVVGGLVIGSYYLLVK